MLKINCNEVYYTHQGRKDYIIGGSWCLRQAFDLTIAYVVYISF